MGVLASQQALVTSLGFNIFVSDAGSNNKQWFNEIHR